MNYLGEVKKDVDLAWEQYNKECNELTESVEKIKELFSEYEWTEQN